MQNKLSFSKNKNKFYIALSSILINNPMFKAKLFEFFDYDIEKIFYTTENDLKEFSEIYENVSFPRNFLSLINGLKVDEIFEKTKQENQNFITYEDEAYPKSLKNLEDFPLMLYFKGNFENINFDKTIAIVGSRNASESAKLNVKNIIQGFVNTDVVIISGLASGIDAAAHQNALLNNLKTVAVIGSGLKYKYPSQNKILYDEIEEKGLIFSEYPYEFQPMPQNFPQRNRIVTGLSKGVIIAEAKMKSGAMISAKFALEQGRELMCIPGNISNPNTEGIYHLIKNGASIITETNDILNTMNWEIKTSKKTKISLNDNEKKIYELISIEEISFEGLKQKLDVGINELMMILTEMELKGLIIQKNGLYYILGN